MAAMLGAGVAGLAQAQSQAVAQPFNYTRASAFTYYQAADGALEGLLKSETVEPGNPALCVTTTYAYDSYGNRSGATTATCSGASATSSFPSRGNTGAYAAVAQQPITVAGTTVNVAVPAGLFSSSISNALSQPESHAFDPRFGAMLSVTGPNGLTTRSTYDDFGRKTRETSADGTSVVTSYCLLSGDISSNSSGCSALSYATNEVPAGAYMVVHTEPHNASDAKMGAYQRVFTDAEGRTLRMSTQAFDGASQPAGTVGSVIVQDMVYSPTGVLVLKTQPYFLLTRSSTISGSQDVGATFTQYDRLGRPVRVYNADPLGSQSSFTFGTWGTRTASVVQMGYAGSVTTVTDDIGRMRTEEKDIDGNVVRVTEPTGAQLVRQFDAFGNLVQTKDALQNLLTATFDARGRKVSLLDPDSGLTTYCYDALGQLKALQTAAMRGNNTAVACPTDIDSSTTAKAEAGWTTLAYDQLGRVRQRSEPEDVSTWAYDSYLSGAACAKGIGKLCESSSSVGSGHRFAFDAFGRLASSSVTTNAAGTTGFASSVAYDTATGRMVTKTYPSGLQITYGYTANGFLNGVQLASQFTVGPLPHTAGGAAGAPVTLTAGTTLWRPTSVDAWGHSTADQLGNGITDRATFDASTGRPATLLAGAGSTGTGALNLAYAWDSVGRVKTRTDNNGAGDANAVIDSYQYDGVDRLKQYSVQSPSVPGFVRTVGIQYDAIGNISSKSDVGTYTYPLPGNSGGVTNPRPHAVATVADFQGNTRHYGYDAGGNLTSVDGGKYTSLSYTSFNLPNSSSGMAGPAGSPRYTYVYDENHQRLREARVDSSGTQVTWFANVDNGGGLMFESEVSAAGVLNNRHYITAGSQTIVLVTTAALPALAVGQTAPSPSMTMAGNKVEYWHQDTMGNLTATSDHAGTVTAYYAYDPFGKRRFPGGSYDASGAIVVPWSTTLDNGTGRGYTTHEQIDDIGLVHMNGRLFDPTIARFLQTDPMLQSPANLQNYNRYSYCVNNPVTCSDPSGQKFLGNMLSLNPLKSLYATNAVSMAAALDIYKVSFPEWYWINTKIAHTKIGYQVGSIAIGIASAYYCSAAAYVCDAIGTAAWATFAGKSSDQALDAGLIAGAMSFMNGAITADLPTDGGEWVPTWAPEANTVARTAMGCISAKIGGSSCGSGAASAFVSAAWANYCAQCGSSNYLSGTLTHAVVGGVASMAGGGSFAQGAKAGATSYVFALAKQAYKQDGIDGVLNLAGKYWTLPNTLVGLAAGVAGMPFGAQYKGFDEKYNAFVFTDFPNLSGQGSAGVTIGNTILVTVPELEDWNVPTYATKDLPLVDRIYVNGGWHEKGHTYQEEVLGPFFFPVYLLSGGLPSASNSFENAADRYALTRMTWWPW